MSDNPREARIIYLQPDDYEGEQSWCVDRITESDTEYILKSEYDKELGFAYADLKLVKQRLAEVQGAVEKAIKHLKPNGAKVPDGEEAQTAIIRAEFILLQASKEEKK